MDQVQFYFQFINSSGGYSLLELRSSNGVVTLIPNAPAALSPDDARRFARSLLMAAEIADGKP